MIITKEFIGEVLIKAKDNLLPSKSELREDVINFAYTLVGEEHLSALNKLSKQIDKAQQISNEDRNDYVPFYGALYDNVDYGFSVGEVVNYKFSTHTQRTGPILSIEGGQVEFKDCWTSFLLVSKYIKEPVQLSIF